MKKGRKEKREGRKVEKEKWFVINSIVGDKRSLCSQISSAGLGGPEMLNTQVVFSKREVCNLFDVQKTGDGGG